MPAFVVEDGTGLTNATSYVSVAEADDYLSIRPNIDDWTDLDSAGKQAQLMWATRLLDQRAVFYGKKTVPASALQWPRTGVIDKNGLLVPYDVVPQPIQDATVEIAFYLLVNSIDPSLPPGGGGVAGGAIKSIKADVIEIEYTEGSAASAVTIYFPLGINDILAGLGTLRGAGGGRGFGRVLRS